MEGGVSRMRLFQRLARLGLVLVLWCVFVTVWAMWENNGYGAQYLDDTNSMRNSFTYYDANRDANPIRTMEYRKTNSACGAGWESLKNLYRWPGSGKGCWEGSKAHHGSCHTKAGKVAAAVQPVTEGVMNWGQGHLCVQRVTLANQSEPVNATKQCTHANNHTQCDECTCVQQLAKVRNCPYTQLQVNDSSVLTTHKDLVQVAGSTVGKWSLWQSKTDGKGQWLTSVEVTLDGACKDGKVVAPKGLKYDLVKQSQCHYRDAAGTVQAGQQSAGDFLNNNANVLKNALALPGYTDRLTASNEVAHLVGRYKLKVGCSAACQGYRFTTHLGGAQEELRSQWMRVRNTLIVSGVFTLLALLLLLWVSLVVKLNAQQWHYLLVLGLTMTLLLVLAVLLGLTASNAGRWQHHVRTAEVHLSNKCVQNVGWNNHLRKLVNQCDMSSLQVWSAVLCSFCCLLLVVGLVVVARTLRQLRRSFEQLADQDNL